MPIRLSGARLALYSAVSFSFAALAFWRAWNATDFNLVLTRALILRSSGYCFLSTPNFLSSHAGPIHASFSVTPRALCAVVIPQIFINLAFNLSLLFAKCIQFAFFGSVSEEEGNKMWDRMVNYLLWKVLVVGAILEPSMEDLVVWTIWFSLVGLMHTFCGLAAERFKNLMTYSPNAVWWAHARLVALLMLLLFADLGWFYLCISVFSAQGRTQVFLLVYECFTLFVDCVSGLVKNLVHFVDLSRGGNWENRGAYMFYTDVIASAIVLAATLGHYVVILFMHGISLNVVDVLIFVNMRIVFLNLKTKIVAYRNYRKLALDMDQRYPQVPQEELQQLNDSCAICREPMVSARRLPCGHIFHTACLRSWLEHNHTCPTCRHPLIDEAAQQNGAQHRGAPGFPPGQPNGGDPRRSVWSFSSGWAGWLPSLSVEVIRSPNFDPNMLLAANPALANQVAMVQNVFPDMPVGVVIQDLLASGSAEMTINNILEGRLVPPPQPVVQQPPPIQPPREQAPSEQPPAPQLSSAPAPSFSTPPSSPLSTSGSFSTATPPSLRDSFGQTTEQRQLSLSQRKMQMLEFARRQFEEKKQREQEALMASSSSSAVESAPAIAPTTSMDDPIQTSGLRHRNVHHADRAEDQQVPQSSPPPQSQPSEDIAPETPEERRRKILEAAQRRLSTSQGM